MTRMTALRWLPGLAATLFAIGCWSSNASAQEPTPTATATATADAPAEAAAEAAAEPAEDPIAKLTVALDTVWVMVCGMLVFFMNLGFGCVESGFARAKNCVNILSKNFVVFAATAIGYYVIGWGLMFGNGPTTEGALDLVGQEGLWMVSGVAADGAVDNSPAIADYTGPYGTISWTGVPLWVKFFFQLVFAGTAATIVSGAVAERIKYLSFIVFSFIMCIAIYPITGHWIWGAGWLAKDGFWDFAGSTTVHSVGGWAALTGAFILGPRIGKYGAEGKVQAIPGHNMTAAFIGCLVLWLGWFGFNPGSTMGAGDANWIALIAVNTNFGAAAGTLAATAVAWLLLGKPDIGMTINGCLAGLVAVTAPCAWISPLASIIIGALGGALVVFAVIGFDKIKIDDPVGATSVHLVNGIFGTICIGLFSLPEGNGRAAGPKAGLFYGGGTEQLMIQLKGILVVGAYTVVASAIAWLLIKYTIGLRVSAEEEIEGLDIGEHGNEAYHGFVMAKSEG